MNSENTAYLIAEFPKIYKSNFVFDVADGWFEIVRYLSFAIQTEIDVSNESTTRSNDATNAKRSKISQVEVLQIKEKFGIIRVYYTGGNELVRHFVFMAEYMSEITCEYCGKLGKLVRSGWVKTVCPACQAERSIDKTKLRLITSNKDTSPTE